MQLNPEQVQADQALLQLGRRLRADGYRFTCVTPATHARNNAREGSERARTLRDVFGWSRPFAPGLISADELQQLQAAQVLTGEGDLLRSTVRWSSLDDLLLVHSAFPTDASDAVFFGPDSYRFAQVIHDHLQRTPKPVQHAVDIGCGTGVGALLIARAAQHAQVSAVDINPLALRYTAINAALAGVGNLGGAERPTRRYQRHIRPDRGQPALYARCQRTRVSPWWRGAGRAVVLAHRRTGM